MRRWQPANPYADANASVNPYPFSVAAARALLADHGWKVVPNGVTTCTRPGTSPGDCGTGIKAGEPLDFTLMYPSGTPTPTMPWPTCSRSPNRSGSQSPWIK